MLCGLVMLALPLVCMGRRCSTAWASLFRRTCSPSPATGRSWRSMWRRRAARSPLCTGSCTGGAPAPRACRPCWCVPCTLQALLVRTLNPAGPPGEHPRLCDCSTCTPTHAAPLRLLRLERTLGGRVASACAACAPVASTSSPGARMVGTLARDVQCCLRDSPGGEDPAVLLQVFARDAQAFVWRAGRGRHTWTLKPQGH